MAIQNTPILGGIAVIDFESNHHNPKAFYHTTPLRFDCNNWSSTSTGLTVIIGPRPIQV
jgi:hypothetical protein